MVNVIVAFLFGMAVMDFMWAWKLGIPQTLWSRWKNRNSRS